MDMTGPAEGQREASAEGDAVAAPGPRLPADGEVVANDGLVSFWCGRCLRWVGAYIEVDGAKRVHERVSHPGPRSRHR